MNIFAGGVHPGACLHVSKGPSVEHALGQVVKYFCGGTLKIRADPSFDIMIVKL